MNADGSGLTRLTSDPAAEFDPAWSPDGRHIVYRRESGGDQTAEIYVMNSDGTGQRNLTRNEVADWGPDWSPDGASIIFNSAAGTEGFGLLGYTMGADGSALRLLSRHFVEYPTWSPDGSKIAFMAQEQGASGSDPDYNIYVMDADGTGIKRLTDAPGEDGFPAWSPDGAKIAFSTTRGDCRNSPAPGCARTSDIGPYQEIWVMNADGSDQHRLSDRFGQLSVWSPDGKWILFSPGLNLVRPDGSGLKMLPVQGSPGDPEFPDWIG